jgi:hypothetical protein
MILPSQALAYGNAVSRDELFVSSTEEPMKKLIAIMRSRSCAGQQKGAPPARAALSSEAQY